MAEPMSSNEIEDVLSSIRRLVAQDLKPGDRAKLAAVADTAQKLVLAPEQRVEDSGAAKFATVRRPSRRAAFPPVDAVLAGVSLAGGADSGREADSSAMQGFALGEEAAQREAEARLAAQNDEWREIEARAAKADAKADDRADDRAYSGAAEPEWQAPYLQPNYDSYDEAEAYDPPQGDAFSIDPNARLFDVAPNAFAGQKLDPTAETEWESAEPESLDDSDIAAEADTQQSLQGTIEPDEAWANAAEARVIAELAGEAVEEEVFQQAKETFREPNFSSATATQSAPEVLFDEDVLRAMVQAIFREEMAGPMGERITRNIRKLVRAEVGRMLAAQELE